MQGLGTSGAAPFSQVCCLEANNPQLPRALFGTEIAFQGISLVEEQCRDGIVHAIVARAEWHVSRQDSLARRVNVHVAEKQRHSL